MTHPTTRRRHYVAQILDACARRGDAPVLWWNDQVLTAAELTRRVLVAAQVLRVRGVGPGTVVGLLTAPNSPPTLLVRYAANLLGATVFHLGTTNAVNPRAAIDATARRAMLTETGASVLVVDEEHLDRGRDLVEGPEGPEGPGGAVALAGTADLGPDVLDLSAGHPAEPTPTGDVDAAIVTYTSGRSGRPKGVATTFDAKADMVATALERTSPTRLLVTAPLSHSSGKMADNALACGGSVVLHTGFAADDVVDALDEHHITRAFLAPPGLYALMDHPRLSPAGIASLESLTYTGLAAAPERLAAAVEVFGDVLYQLYGSTECGPISWLAPTQHRRPALLDTVGRPVHPARVEIRDADGADPLPTGAEGEVWVRSPWAMAGYWRDPELTARTVRDGWIRTGDLAECDEHGYLRLRGRIADVVKTKGIKVHPTVVEHALLAHPDVREAAVFGHADAQRVESVHAAVVLSDGAATSAEALRDHVERRLNPEHAPVGIQRYAELPLTDTGKPDIRSLRAAVGTDRGPDRPAHAATASSTPAGGGRR